MKKIFNIFLIFFSTIILPFLNINCGVNVRHFPFDKIIENNNKTLEVINELSKSFIVKPTPTTTLIDLYYLYKRTASECSEVYKQIENKNNEFINIFKVETKIHWLWYESIANFMIHQYTLNKEILDNGYIRNLTPNKETLNKLIKTMNLDRIYKISSFTFLNFFQNEYEPLILKNEKLWKNNAIEQQNKIKIWNKIMNSFNEYYDNINNKFSNEIERSIFSISKKISK